MAYSGEKVDNNNIDYTLRQDKCLWYDYRLFASECGLQGLISCVNNMVDQVEQAKHTRMRARKRSDEISFRRSIESILSNVSYVIVQWGVTKPVIISREKCPTIDTNINCLPVGTFLKALDLLVDCGLIVEDRGQYNGHSTTIRASVSLLDLLQSRSLTFQSFRRQPEMHLVKLKRITLTGAGREPKREQIPLPSGGPVRAMSARVARLNDFLAASDLSFVDDGLKPGVDTVNRREMTRHFTIRGTQAIRFDQGGRLFGQTYWLNLPSNRRGGLRIGGEPVADLDFKNLGPRIAYTLLSQEPPPGDLYDLTGLLDGYNNENPDHRKAIKQSFASCLNGGAGGTRSPNQRTGKPGILAPLPKGTSAAKVRAALLLKHPGFQAFFERDPATEVPVGYEIMFMESCILLCALERLKDASVAALPFHDGLMVAQSKAQLAMDALGAASREILGVALPVEAKVVHGHSGASMVKQAA